MRTLFLFMISHLLRGGVSTTAQSVISPNNDLVVMPHDPSPPHHMPILPSTKQESMQHNDHAPDEPDISFKVVQCSHASYGDSFGVRNN
ncbi:unnamed protein product [Prunus armeniaca]|uniref:Uncharacterized protein n=1 Tax=Prunus armeniaca TaxID=36596 RepID=A0A6J5TGW4_PRUAR|nr:unnamed protein product [Prunus armeniaca]